MICNSENSKLHVPGLVHWFHKENSEAQQQHFTMATLNT